MISVVLNLLKCVCGPECGIFVNLPCEHENNVCSVVAIIHRCELYPVHKCYFLNIYLFGCIVS